MNGELIPVFVAGKLMGFRRKKNDRLLMFILRHYGQDAEGRKTTINYFSTRATAGAASAENPPLDFEGRGTSCKLVEGPLRSPPPRPAPPPSRQSSPAPASMPIPSPPTPKRRMC